MALELEQQLRRGVVLAPARDRDRERAQQDVVDRPAVRGGHRRQQRPGQPLGQRQRVRVRRPDGVARVVDRTRAERWVGAVEHVAPERELGLARARLRRLGGQLRPARERRRDRRQLDRRAGEHRVEGPRQVLEQDAPRDAVDDEMVGDEQQPAGHVGTGVQPGRAQHPPGGRVELRDGPLGGRLDLRGERARAVAGDALEQLADRRRAGLGHRQRPVGLQPRAQQPVVVDRRLQHGLELRRLDPGRQLQQGRLVEALQRRAQLARPVDDRRRRDAADAGVVLAGRAVGADRLGGRRERGDGAQREDVARAQRKPAGPRAADERDRDDAVAAELEEAVLHADRGQPEQLGEQVGQQLLLGRRRRLVAGEAGPVDRRQRVAIELAVGVHRQRAVERHDRRRDHVVGQPLGDVRAQRRRVGRARIRIRHDVGDQARDAAVAVGDHGGLADVGAAHERGFDLADLDAVAADLDLLVGAAGEVEVAIGAPAHAVARAVHARAGRAVAGERVGDEALGAQARAAEVAAREPPSADVQLADDAGGDRAQRIVEDVAARVRIGRADRHGAVPTRRRHPQRRVDGRLRQAVGDGDAHRPRPARDELRGDALRPHDEHRAGRQLALRRHRRHERRRQDHVRHTLLADEPRQLDRRRARLRRHEHERPTGTQRHRQVEHRHVEADRRVLQHAALRPQIEAILRRRDEAADPLMRDDDTLRPARRPRRVDHIGRPIEPQPLPAVVAHHLERPAQPRIVEHQQLDAIEHRQHRRRRAIADHDTRTRVLQHERDPLNRMIEIQRQVRRPGALHPQQRRHQLDRTLQRHPHDLLGPRRTLDQQRRHPPRHPLKLAVAHLTPTVDDRHRLRPPRHPRGEPRRQRRLLDHTRRRVEALQQRQPVGSAEQLDVCDLRLAADRGADAVERGEEALLVLGQLALVADGGVDVEVDQRRGPVTAVVQRQAQPRHRAGPEVVRRRRPAADLEVVVERHDVDARAVDVVAGRPLEPAEQLGAVVARVFEQLQDVAGDVLDEPPHGRAGGGAHAQRQDVGHHSRPLAMGGVQARRHGQREHEILVSGDALQLDGHRRQQHVLRADAEPVGRRLERLHPGAREPHAAPAQAPHVLRRRRDEAGGLGRQVAHPLAPEVTVAGVALGVAVGEVGVDERPQRPVRRRLLRPVVERRDAARDQRQSGAVHRDVVVALVPQVALLADPQQQLAEQRIARQVDGARPLAAHPRLGRGPRIGPVAQIDRLERPVRLRRGDLARLAVDLIEAHMQALRLADRLAQRPLEALAIQGAADLEVLGNVVDRAVGLELLREPDARLRAGQGQAGGLAVAIGQDRTWLASCDDDRSDAIVGSRRPRSAGAGSARFP